MISADISADERAVFERDGYIVLRNFLKNDTIADIKQEIERIGKFIIGEKFEFSTYDEALISPQKQSALYDRLHYLPSLSRLSGNL
ncbi:MAG: phytanoyl-CoA dioxygenase family protein, partial [Undibacterium sp.]|nr:phytanoyl-CoA dioxygenase family protein [Undibacterium sp.]